MNYIENNTENFEQVLWAIELKFLIPFFSHICLLQHFKLPRV